MGAFSSVKCTSFVSRALSKLQFQVYYPTYRRSLAWTRRYTICSSTAYHEPWSIKTRYHSI